MTAYYFRLSYPRGLAGLQGVASKPYNTMRERCAYLSLDFPDKANPPVDGSAIAVSIKCKAKINQNVCKIDYSKKKKEREDIFDFAMEIIPQGLLYEKCGLQEILKLTSRLNFFMIKIYKMYIQQQNTKKMVTFYRRKRAVNFCLATILTILIYDKMQ